MISFGIPLEESYLRYRLSVLMKEENNSLRKGRLYIPDSYNLMGTADPTGTLKEDEVCVILYVSFSVSLPCVCVSFSFSFYLNDNGFLSYMLYDRRNKLFWLYCVFDLLVIIDSFSSSVWSLVSTNIFLIL